ncbi:MAG: hypothetical protein EOM25_04645 [Deltaproteobacteria bacterium]|nr:hypothetical protein [Deltaproteobacteria bacterium]
MRIFFPRPINCLVFLLFFVIPQTTWAEEFLVIDDSKFAEFGGLEKNRVYFSHDYHADHYQIECKHCHHVYKNGVNIWDESMPVDECSVCHGTNKVELTNAYHMNCWGCHKRLKEIESRSDAPTVQCNACHLSPSDYAKEKKRVDEKLKTNNVLIDKFLKSGNIKGFSQ